MKELRIQWPDDLSLSGRRSEEEIVQHLRLMAAVKMFEIGEISNGRAAEIAGLTRIEFIEACGEYRVSQFNYPDDQVAVELASDLEIAKAASVYRREDKA